MDQLGAQDTAVKVGAAEASWPCGSVQRHASHVKAMEQRVVQEGVPDDMSAQTILDKATGTLHLMSIISRYFSSQLVLVTQPRVPDPLSRGRGCVTSGTRP